MSESATVGHNKIERVVIATDGGARGNPGPAAIGVVIRDAEDPDGAPLVEISEAIGKATNNLAEYEAIIAGLEAAKGLGAREVVLRADSQLAIEQLKGSYRVRNAGLRPLWRRARRIADEFDTVRLEHVKRALNKEADALVNLALDRA